MKFIRFYPYKAGSQSVSELRAAIPTSKIIHPLPITTYRPKPKHLVVNWGASSMPAWADSLEESGQLLNPPFGVYQASNKLETFRVFEREFPSPQEWLPPFTTFKNIAQAWLDAGKRVVVRHTLTGHSGQGIQIVEPEEELPDAPLYVKYINKAEEYRVHVLKDQILQVNQKRRRRDVLDEDVDWKIRNYANGFIYSMHDIDSYPPLMETMAISTVKKLGLHFGAVDVILTTREKVYVLEVNTAPGLEGARIGVYAQAFQEYANGL